MENNQPTIALDVDGVLLDFVPAWISYAERLLGRKLNWYNPSSYRMHEKLDITRAEADAVWNLFNAEGGWLTLQAIPGAPAVVAELKKYAQVVAVTASDPKHTEQREQNLRELDMEMPVFAVGIGGCKREVLHRLQPRMFVEDMVHNLEAAPAGTERIWLNTGLEQERGWREVVSTHYPDLHTWFQQNPTWASQLRLTA